ncbi:MAG: hypothetical protein AAF950_15050 [Pseudomonadota bacterium]
MTGTAPNTISAVGNATRRSPSADIIRLADLPYRDDTKRWPLWKTSLLVLLLCGGFWSAIIYTMIHYLT